MRRSYRCPIGHIFDHRENRNEVVRVRRRVTTGIHARRIVSTADEWSDRVNRATSFVKKGTGNRIVDEFVEVAPLHLCGVDACALSENGNLVRAEGRSDVIQNPNELGNGNQDPWLATAVRASLFAVERRTVLVLDNADRFISKPRDIGRTGDNGPEADAGAERVE